MKKTCTGKCGETKDGDEFYPNRSKCKVCFRADVKLRQAGKPMSRNAILRRRVATLETELEDAVVEFATRGKEIEDINRILRQFDWAFSRETTALLPDESLVDLVFNAKSTIDKAVKVLDKYECRCNQFTPTETGRMASQGSAKNYKETA